MAKYNIEYTNDNIIYTLFFRGVKFIYDINKQSESFCFAKQISDYFDDISYEQIDSLYVDFIDNSEADILEKLNKLERN